MEALTKKNVTIEFEGKKYALQDSMTIGDFLTDLGFPKEMTVTLKITKDGFVMVRL
jgi:sulfur carrier protein ThiS